MERIDDSDAVVGDDAVIFGRGDDVFACGWLFVS